MTADFKVSLAVLTFIWILADFFILLSYALLMQGNVVQRHKRTIALLSSAFLLLIALLGFLYTLSGWQS